MICECCKKPAKKVFGIFEPKTRVLVDGEDVGILEVTACTRACAREWALGTQSATPKVPKGVKIIELET